MGRKDRGRWPSWLFAAIFITSPVGAQPVVQNPSFEKDRFTRYPGYAKANGGKITGWKFEGSVGVNPWWKGEQGNAVPVHDFSDNGRIPQGRQVAFIQNIGKLRQKIPGFKKGRKYRVTYFENARRQNWNREKPPQIRVTLGGETIVSLHPVAPVEEHRQRRLPFDRVQSAVFVPPEDGAYELVFETTVNNRVTVLIDNVSVKEAR